MTAQPPPEAEPLRIMAFAPEMKRIVAPKTLRKRNYELSFHKFDTTERLDHYDGIIVFQGVFEEIEFVRDRWMGNEHMKHRYAKNELHRRIKELNLLFESGGFVCFVLCEPFYDENGGLSETDLVKYFLSLSDLHRYNFQNRVPQVRTVLSEFKPFLDVFGAATSYFDISSRYAVKPIARAQGKLVGMILGRHMICVPAQLPDTTDGTKTPRAQEFFEALTDAVVAVVKKQAAEIPEWADAFKFEKEQTAITRRGSLTQELSEVNAEIDSFRTFKWILLYADNELVDAVKDVIERGFGFKVEAIDELKEDLKLLDPAGKPFLFAEVKGTNAGVKREHVNQADSHRERAGLPSTFPSLLIMNTAIKNARSLAEKDEAVASEQVEHAKRHNILIMRTLDLLRLLSLHQRGVVTKDEVQRLLSTSAGWLKVTDDAYEVLPEEKR